MSTAITHLPASRPSLISKIAAKYSVDADKMLTTLKATAFKAPKNGQEVSNEQLMALLIVADQYDLNPWTKEIYAFPDKQNGIVPVVGLDGWSRIINSNPEFDGMEFVESENLVQSDEHKPCPEWIECRIYRKDRSRFIAVRERFSECYRAPFKGQYGLVNGPWQSHTSRFLRHKAMIQAARLAFGFVGIYDPDEADRIRDAIDITPTVVTGQKPATEPPKAKPTAQAEITQVPVAELRAAIDSIGIAESEFCARFEIGAVEELALSQVAAAQEYLNGLRGA